jgi:tetratricopeptide (TPR) repeat protein
MWLGLGPTSATATTGLAGQACQPSRPSERPIDTRCRARYSSCHDRDLGSAGESRAYLLVGVNFGMPFYSAARARVMTASTGRLKRAFDWKEFVKRAEGHEERADLSGQQLRLNCDDEAALPDLHGRLGEILERRGDVAGAIECYKEALALDTAQKDWLGVAADQRRLGAAYQ